MVLGTENIIVNEKTFREYGERQAKNKQSLK